MFKMMMQARDVEKALDAFTHAVQLDPENGEAWNNIACLYAHFSSIIFSFCLFLIYYIFISSPQDPFKLLQYWWWDNFSF